MKEFMLYVRNLGNHDADWSEKQQEEFLKKCEAYIEDLKNDGKLISAQPLEREGKTLLGPKGQWKEASLNEMGEIQVGYYHIRAENFAQAMEIAKKNPEFEYGTSAKVEVREIKTKEQTTGFVYPME